jgi:putative PIN family toxin of toxin-antitoxin system
MIDAVLDTNVVVSALLSPDGLPSLTLRLALDRHIQCYVSEALFAEYEDVCGRTQLNLSAVLAKTTLREIRKTFTKVVPTKRVTRRV